MSQSWMLLAGALSLAFAAGAPASASDDWSRFGLEVEAGPFWATRNDVKIPPATGTPFSLLDLTGKGPESYFRAYASVNLNRRHGIRFLAAPLEIRGFKPL